MPRARPLWFRANTSSSFFKWLFLKLRARALLACVATPFGVLARSFFWNRYGGEGAGAEPHSLRNGKTGAVAAAPARGPRPTAGQQRDLERDRRDPREANRDELAEADNGRGRQQDSDDAPSRSASERHQGSDSKYGGAAVNARHALELRRRQLLQGQPEPTWRAFKRVTARLREMVPPLSQRRLMEAVDQDRSGR
jgi:hypothetical protein